MKIGGRNSVRVTVNEDADIFDVIKATMYVFVQSFHYKALERLSPVF